MADRMTAIKNAMTQLEAKPEPAPAPVAAPSTPAPAPAAEPVKAAPAAPSVARDDAGRFAPKGEEKPAAVAAPPAEAPKPTAPRYKAPQSWRPEVREKWGAIPEEVQAEIERTAKAEADRVRRAAEAEKRWGSVSERVRAFGNPDEVIDQALRTVATLRTGTAREKAALVAQMVGEYGIGVEELDRTLAERLGGQPAQGQPPQPAELRDPRFDQFMGQIEAAKKAKIAADIEAFRSKAEFFEDVESDMGALLQAGIAKDLQTAYDTAIALPKNREIAAILEQRKAAEAARTASAATERAAQAASSVRASPVTGADSKPRSRRDVIASHM